MLSFIKNNKCHCAGSRTTAKICYKLSYNIMNYSFYNLESNIELQNLRKEKEKNNTNEDEDGWILINTIIDD
jgi:hypothetical protein